MLWKVSADRRASIAFPVLPPDFFETSSSESSDDVATPAADPHDSPYVDPYVDGSTPDIPVEPYVTLGSAPIMPPAPLFPPQPEVVIGDVVLPAIPDVIANPSPWLSLSPVPVPELGSSSSNPITIDDDDDESGKVADLCGKITATIFGMMHREKDAVLIERYGECSAEFASAYRRFLRVVQITKEMEDQRKASEVRNRKMLYADRKGKGRASS